MKILKYSIFLFSFLFGLKASPLLAYDMRVSAGNLCEFIGKIQTNDSGSTNLCSFNPFFAGSVDYSLSQNFLLSPEFGLTLPKSGRDTNISKMSLFTLLNAKYRFKMLELKGGGGLFFTRIAGKGGTQTLNNGSTSSSFPMPDATVYTRNFIINLGLSFPLDNDWSAGGQTYVFNALESEDRAFSVLIFGTYHFGEL